MKQSLQGEGRDTAREEWQYSRNGKRARARATATISRAGRSNVAASLFDRKAGIEECAAPSAVNFCVLLRRAK